MKKTFQIAILLLSFCSLAKAAELRTLEADFTPMQYAAKNSLGTSTHSVTGIGLHYKIFVSSPLISVNGSHIAGSYHINWTTGTSRATSGAITAFKKGSSETFIPINTIWEDDFNIAGYDPQFVFSGLNTEATLYFQLEYGEYPTR